MKKHHSLLGALVLSVSIHLSIMQDKSHAHSPESESRFIQVKAKDKYERTRLSELGLSIEAIRSDSVWGFASPSVLDSIKKSGKKVMGIYSFETGRGGHEGILDFPPKDARFHNYQETYDFLKNLVSKNANISKLVSIGKTIENRDIWGIHINTSPEALVKESSGKPGIVYMGAHHAREHLSVEVPLMFAQYLLENKNDAKIAQLLENRDIWIFPMINPDGAEYDIESGRYKYWRKNRRDNKDSTFGVDLNRNYAHRWGTGGSSNDTSSDVYMGPSPFSEPETIAVKNFVESHSNLKVLLSVHTFSELILYPWGSTYDAIENEKDLKVYETMARQMAQWNGYTPQQSSDLYIASGDTTDWSYAEKGIFSFTFELSPKDMWGGGGFYPGAGVIDKTFQDNLKPFLYLLDSTDDPYKVIGEPRNSFLKNYVAPAINYHAFW